MPFTCPKCQSPDQTLNIVDSLELPPDSLYDEITLQILKCSKCSFSGIAIYEESRRGALDNEFTSHTAYQIEKENLTKIKDMIRRCPEPSNALCECKAHKVLGTQNSSGRWKGITGLNKRMKFEMKR